MCAANLKYLNRWWGSGERKYNQIFLWLKNLFAVGVKKIFTETGT